MDTGHSCRQNLPTIVQVLCKEGDLSNKNENCRLACKNLQAELRKLQAGLKRTLLYSQTQGHETSLQEKLTQVFPSLSVPLLTRHYNLLS